MMSSTTASHNLSLCFQLSTTLRLINIQHGRQLSKASPLDAVRKLAAFQFEVARLSGLVEASQHQLACTTSQATTASKLSSSSPLIICHCGEARYRHSSRHIIHRVQLRRSAPTQDQLEQCKDAIPSLSLKRVLLHWLPYLLLNLAILCMKASSKGSPRVVSLPSQSEVPLLGFDKTKYALMPSYYCFDNEPEPASLLFPPRLNGHRRLLLALHKAITSSRNWMRSHL